MCWHGTERKQRRLVVAETEETDAECFLGVWDASDVGAIIQVLGDHYIVHRRRLASGGAESTTGAGKVGADGKDLGERRGG